MKYFCIIFGKYFSRSYSKRQFYVPFILFYRFVQSVLSETVLPLLSKIDLKCLNLLTVLTSPVPGKKKFLLPSPRLNIIFSESNL